MLSFLYAKLSPPTPESLSGNSERESKAWCFQYFFLATLTTKMKPDACPLLSGNPDHEDETWCLSTPVWQPLPRMPSTLSMLSFPFFFPVPVRDVESVLGGSADLPCDILPEEAHDDVYLVLWFKDEATKPMYRWEGGQTGSTVDQGGPNLLELCSNILYNRRTKDKLINLYCIVLPVLVVFLSK